MDPNQKYFHDFIPSRRKFQIKNEKEKRYEHGKKSLCTVHKANMICWIKFMPDQKDL